MMLSATNRIEKQIEIAAPVSRVWKALTDHREFGEWFRVNLESPVIPGRPTRGNILHPGYEHLVMQVVVEKIEPETYFSYHWHPYAVKPEIDYSKETPTLVEFFLEPLGKGTLLRAVESGFDKIPLGRRDEAFRMNSGGWEIQVKNINAYVTQKA